MKVAGFSPVDDKNVKEGAGMGFITRGLIVMAMICYVVLDYFAAALGGGDKGFWEQGFKIPLVHYLFPDAKRIPDGSFY